MQVEGQRFGPSSKSATGARVRNAYAIYLLQEDSPGKLGLILHGHILLHDIICKDLLVKDEHASN